MKNEQAYLSYVGATGYSKTCTEAILDLLGRGERVEKVKLLSSPKNKEGHASHGFFISFEVLGWFVVLPGYGSGYGGSGPHHLSRAIGILDAYDINFPEIDLTEEQFDRLKSGSLLDCDIDYIYNHPKYYTGDTQDYLFSEHFTLAHNWGLIQRFDTRVPLPNLHALLQPLAFDIFDRSEDTLRKCYVILEQHLKLKSDLDSQSSKFIDKAFSPRTGNAKLSISKDDGQQDGFKLLVKGVFQLHRNQIMHNSDVEFHKSRHNIMSEFLMINHILRLSDYIVPIDYLPEEEINIEDYLKDRPTP